uniref:Galactokinase n=1 Tax=Lygus hesperus TaxID=30085 RepID=A0A0A9YJ32_LYGHE
MPPSYPDSRIRATLAVMKPHFYKTFKTHEEDVEWLLFTFAPGRVNFYGEHVDYMGGYVCPAGLKEGCHILVGRVKRYSDVKLRFATTRDQYLQIDCVSKDGVHNKD